MDTLTRTVLNKEIQYSVRESKKAKRMTITVDWNGACEVVIPHTVRWSDRDIDRLFAHFGAWVVENVEARTKNADLIPLQHKGIPVIRITEETRLFVEQMICDFSTAYPVFSVRQISVRSFKTRWGSCHKGGHLKFHYKLSLLPRHLAEYVVIHELCHLVHFNHSKGFWALVEDLCPTFKQDRKELKKYLI